jgi:hypothetical protein
MKITNFVTRVALVAFVLTAAAEAGFGQKVRYNFMPGTDFAKYRTYRWVRVEKADYPNEIIDAQITRSIDAQLGQKGLSKIESEGADLLITYQAAISQEKEWNAYSYGGDYWGGGWGWGGWRGGYWGGGPSTTTSTTRTINIGTLRLDFYDREKKQMVWRGEATKTLDPPKEAHKLQKKIDNAMKKLLKNYPPKEKD